LERRDRFRDRFAQLKRAQLGSSTSVGFSSFGTDGEPILGAASDVGSSKNGAPKSAYGSADFWNISHAMSTIPND
jgi:hypothetical protein